MEQAGQKKIDYTDPLSQYRSGKTAKVVSEMPKRKHEEANLHLAFCKWVKLQYPKLSFIRHEREKARSYMMQNLFKMYNSHNDKMPDFECLNPVNGKSGFLIEFKKPGLNWLMRDGITIKKDFDDQYKCHLMLWELNRVVYFCNDFEDAKRKLILYLDGKPEKKQEYFVNL